MAETRHGLDPDVDITADGGGTGELIAALTAMLAKPVEELTAESSRIDPDDPELPEDVRKWMKDNPS